MESQQYILVCGGISCADEGALELRDHFAAYVTEGRFDRVVVLPYNCFGLCGRGPNVVVYPADFWYAGVQPQDIPAVVKSAIDSKPVRRLKQPVSQGLMRLCHLLFEDVISICV